MGVVILVAYDDKRVIGNHGKIPWHISEDLKLFKQRTMGHAVLMGRKTYESLPVKPLPQRKNIVVTRDASLLGKSTDDVLYVSDIMPACEEARKEGKDIFIIGGAKIYELALKLGIVDRIIASKVNGSHDGDTHFPMLPESRWECKKLEEYNDFQVLEFNKRKK